MEPLNIAVVSSFRGLWLALDLYYGRGEANLIYFLTARIGFCRESLRVIAKYFFADAIIQDDSCGITKLSRRITSWAVHEEKIINEIVIFSSWKDIISDWNYYHSRLPRWSHRLLRFHL
ncbi:MAG: hypothetical protein WC858_05655 [Parcubacteria group bacterium]|jgi:hypothetical protein